MSSPPTTHYTLDTLTTLLQSTLKPIMHYGQSLKARIAFASVLRRYLTDVSPCLQSHSKVLTLVRKNTQESIVFFEKHLGGSNKTQSIAYMSTGRGFGRLFKFSSKVIKGDQEEIVVLEKMSKLVEDGICPNMPVVYKTVHCKDACKLPQCPSFLRSGNYSIVISELADMDLVAWFRQSHTQEEYESIIMQILLAVYAFHNLGYTHNDCHLGNFLVHSIPAGGYWLYSVDNTNIYVPNHGWLLVLWDPGLAEAFIHKGKVLGTITPEDYTRPLTLISNLKEISKITKYSKLGLHSIPEKMLTTIGISSLLKNIEDIAKANFSDILLMRRLIEGIRDHNYLPSILVGGDTAPGNLLNSKGYPLVRYYASTIPHLLTTL